MKINISGLNKEKIILSLFKNVYGKSAESKFSFGDETDEELMEMFVKPALSQSPSLRIEYVGPVKMSIDFSGDMIDTSTYDRMHKTGTNGSERALTVIEKLKTSAEEKNNNFSSVLSNNSVFKKEIAELKLDNDVLRETVAGKLKAFFACDSCNITYVSSMKSHMVYFNPEKKIESIREVVSYLEKSRIHLKALEGFTALDNTKVPNSVVILSPLNETLKILNELSEKNLSINHHGLV